MTKLFTLLKKDLNLELRRGEASVILLFLAIALSVIVAAGVHNAGLEAETIRRAFPAFLWMVFIFSATVSLGRTTEQELEHRAFEGVLLSGVDPSTIYVAKFLSNLLLVLLGQIFTLFVLPALCGVAIRNELMSFLWLSLGVTVGYAALATLLSGISSSSRIRGLLLPLILLPLLFPLFFCAVELSNDLLSQGSVSIESFWLSLLLGLDVVYFTLGFFLYPAILKE